MRLAAGLGVGALAIGGFVGTADAAGLDASLSDAPVEVSPISCDRWTTTTPQLIAKSTGAHSAWRDGFTGAGIDVAVIDTGVNEVGGLEGKVLDGPDLSFDAPHEGLRHRDVYGHGTHLAGLIAGQHKYGRGMAPDARIVNIKAGAADGSVDVSQVIAAIDWAVENRNANGMNIRVITLAYGTDAKTDYRTDPLSHAVENAWRHGIVVVAAAGNDGRAVIGLANPALNPFVIAVGGARRDASTASGFAPADWTTRGDGHRDPDVIAPGECVISTGVAGSFLAEHYPTATRTVEGVTYMRGTGTSQSTAVVAGAAALLLQQRPDLTPDQVKSLLVNGAADLHSAPELTTGDALVAGSGLLDVAAAMTAPTPSEKEAHQGFEPATGGGSLDAARGSMFVGSVDDGLRGELTAFGAKFDSASHAHAERSLTTWSDQTWTGASWSTGSWAGASWSGASWSGASWSGASWSGASWSGASWSGASWSGASWSGASWSGASWSGASWSGASWSGASWSGASWSGAGWHAGSWS